MRQGKEGTEAVSTGVPAVAEDEYEPVAEAEAGAGRWKWIRM